MTKIAITGASGFIGASLAQHLESRCFQVTRVRRHISVNKLDSGYNLEYADFHSYQSIKKAFSGSDIVLHLASANSSECERDPYNCISEALTTLKNIYDACCNAGVKTLFFFSSVHVYSDHLIGYFDESSYRLNRHPYALQKSKSEDLLMRLSKHGKTRVVILRLSNVIGISPGFDKEREDFVYYNFSRQLLKSGDIEILNRKNVQRDYVGMNFLHLVVDQLIQIHFEKKVSLYNLTSANSLSLTELANLIITNWPNTFSTSPLIKHRFEKKVLEKRLLISNERLMKYINVTNIDIQDDLKNVINYVKT